MNWLEIRRVEGPAAIVKDIHVTPEARAVIMRLPLGTVTWNRPVAVRVEQGDAVSRIPVHDWARLGELTILFMTIAAPLIAARISRR